MGAKKKSLSNRLAKMSDEERARYLQHRAAIEEEARRRKEQLIATFIKNKIKKEEAFTRLNIAKINEHWHQILRRIKIKELKQQIEDLRIWITKILDIKNSIINRLLKEIEEAELQYQNNLQSHFSHIDNIIEIHYDRQKNLKDDFGIHKGSLLNTAVVEMKSIIDNGEKDQTYLKTILFGLEKNFNDIQRQLKNFRDGKIQDYSNSLKADWDAMVKTYSIQMDKIWQDVSTLLRNYLKRTTTRRHHYIELKYLDERNTQERLENKKKISKYTELLNILKMEYDYLHLKNEAHIKDLTEIKTTLNDQLRETKRSLTSTIRRDEKKLQHLTKESNSVLKDLEKTLDKGNSIENLITWCRRLETEDEKAICWAKLIKKFDIFEDPQAILGKVNSKKKFEVIEDTKEIVRRDDSKSESELSTSDSVLDDPKEEMLAIEDVAYSMPAPEEYEILKKLDGLLWCYNRAEIECAKMKQEKVNLAIANKNMKNIVKSVLQDAALQPPMPVEHIKIPVQIKIMSAPIILQRPPFRSIDL